MKNFTIHFIAFALISIISLNTAAQKIDTSPLDAYWKMIEPLKKGDSLSEETWEHFINLEANQIYIENQGFDKAYLKRLKKAIEIVYMPQYDTILQNRIVAIKKDPSSFWLTYKVYVYKANEEALKAYQKEILQPRYIDAIYKNTFTMLPKHLQKKDTNVTVRFLGIENDAIAGSGLIITTLWSAYNQDKLKMGMLNGHEMHHVLRKPISFKNVAESDKGIMYVLNSILNEGTADIIDKAYNIAHEEELPMECRYKDFVLFQADSIIKQLDTSLIILAQSDGKQYNTEKEYRNILRWSSGHCPGYYMADIIIRNGYKKQLLRHIQNPFQFVYLYNKAAQKDKLKPPVFTDRSINYIKLMERNYWHVKEMTK